MGTAEDDQTYGAGYEPHCDLSHPTKAGVMG